MRRKNAGLPLLRRGPASKLDFNKIAIKRSWYFRNRAKQILLRVRFLRKLAQYLRLLLRRLNQYIEQKTCQQIQSNGKLQNLFYNGLYKKHLRFHTRMFIGNIAMSYFVGVLLFCNTGDSIFALIYIYRTVSGLLQKSFGNVYEKQHRCEKKQHDNLSRL